MSWILVALVLITGHPAYPLFYVTRFDSQAACAEAVAGATETLAGAMKAQGVEHYRAELACMTEEDASRLDKAIKGQPV